jgi:hypothetical protein
VEKYSIARQATDDNIIRRMRFAYWINDATDIHSENVSFRSPDLFYLLVHSRCRGFLFSRDHARTPARAHTHTQQ